jgi:hypothetical protein
VAFPEISSISGTNYARLTIYSLFCSDFFTEGPEQCDGGLLCNTSGKMVLFYFLPETTCNTMYEEHKIIIILIISHKQQRIKWKVSK